MTLDELNAVLRGAAETVEERFTDQLARKYEASLRSTGFRMSERFRVKAIEAPIVAAATFLPPDEDDVVPDNRAGPDTDATRRRAARVLEAELEAAGISFTVGGIFSEELLDQIGARATFAADRELRAIFRSVIQEAMAEGWSVPDTARQIRSRVQAMAPHRAVALARTDLIGLSNAGNHRAALLVTSDRERGTTYKQWLATEDERTREAHREAHGQVVPINEPFNVGGEPLQYPGDWGGSAENVINCRCTTLYQDTVDGEPAIRAAAYDATVEQEASMSETITEETTAVEPIPWDATLCVEGAPTEDGRLLDPGSLRWRDLPLTLMGMTRNPEGGFGHDGAEVSGRIDSIERHGADIDGVGEFTTDFGVNTLEPMVRDRTVRGVSVDLAVMAYEYRDAETGEPVTIEEILLGEEERDVLFAVTDGVILGATVCPMQAVEDAQITVTASAAGPEGIRITVFTPFDRSIAPTITASAADDGRAAVALSPARAAFEVTEFPGPTPLTVTDDGRVFGHIATWDTCHVGIPGVCTTAPRSRSGYAYFHTGEIVTEEGDALPVGKLVFGTKHASIEASRRGAAQHYDDYGKVGAIVRAHDGDFGVWVSGILRPGISEEEIAEIRLNPPSGDWRRIDGALELIAALSVPVPGLPTPRAEAGIRASADVIEVTALIASAGVIVPDALVASAMEQAGCTNLPERIDGVEEIAALLD